MSVEPCYLFRHLSEAAFRLNEREGEDADRFKKVLKFVAGPRLTYSELTGRIIPTELSAFSAITKQLIAKLARNCNNGLAMAYIPGAYEVSLQGYETFVPDPLPPPLSLPIAVEKEVEEATHLLGQVEMCRTLLPNADLLTYNSLRREALANPVCKFS